MFAVYVLITDGQDTQNGLGSGRTSDLTRNACDRWHEPTRDGHVTGVETTGPAAHAYDDVTLAQNLFGKRSPET
jgi:hypothetical protein